MRQCKVQRHVNVICLIRRLRAVQHYIHLILNGGDHRLHTHTSIHVMYIATSSGKHGSRWQHRVAEFNAGICTMRILPFPCSRWRWPKLLIGVVLLPQVLAHVGALVGSADRLRGGETMVVPHFGEGGMSAMIFLKALCIHIMRVCDLHVSVASIHGGEDCLNMFTRAPGARTRAPCKIL